MYRVTHRIFSEMAKNFIMVDSDVDADSFRIIDSNAVFYRLADAKDSSSELKPILALPPTFWFQVTQIDTPDAGVLGVQ